MSPVVHALLAVLVLTTIPGARAWSEECPREVVVPALATHAENVLNSSRLLQELPNPNTTPGALPPPLLTQKDAFDAASRTIARARNRAGADAPQGQDSLVLFAFQRRSLVSDDSRVVPVPAASFKCLIRPGDLLVLGAGSSYHMTMVWGHSRDRETFILSDQWPRDYNVTPARIVRYADIPREDFISPDSMGASSNDVLDLWKTSVLLSVKWSDLALKLTRVYAVGSSETVDFFLRSIFRPGTQEPSPTPAALLALGDTLFLAHTERFSSPAMWMNAEAFRAARSAGDVRAERTAVSRRYGASIVAAYKAGRENDQATVAQVRKQLQDLAARYELPILEEELTGRRLFLVATAAIGAADPMFAISILGRRGEHGEWYEPNDAMRLQILGALGRKDEVRVEGNRVLTRVTERLNILRGRLLGLQPNDLINRQLAETEIHRLELVEASVRETLASASR